MPTSSQTEHQAFDPNIDKTAIPLWNDAYVNGAENLWGDPPVPAAEAAARVFKENGAFTVLDMPCGDGRNLPALAEGGRILLGADTSANALDISEQVVTRAGVSQKTALLQLDAYAMKVPSGSLDGVFCWDLLGHLTEPVRALHELVRVLRPGGRLVANMWTMNDCQVNDPNIREVAPRTYIDHFGFYCEFYGRSDIDTLLDRAGLVAESVVLAQWSEPPHVGYRDYPHDHESWVITLTKTAS